MRMTLEISIILFISCLSIFNTVFSQPTLLKDIYPGSESSINLFQPFNKLGNKLLFAANDGIHANEFWLTDGTNTGTIRLNDNFEDLNDTYYYFRNGTVGQGIGKTDGTASGTILLKDGFTHVSRLTNVNGIRFFVANVDASNLEELWKTDGTTSGTVVVKKLRPNSFFNAYTTNLIAAPNGTYLLFTANNGTGMALWKSDGTTAGTTIVKYFANTPQHRIGNFVNFNNEVYFFAYNASGFDSLWKTDGTTAGTVLVYEKIQSNMAYGCIVYNNNIYFNAQSQIPPFNYGAELWVSDGTNAGTRMFFDTNSGEPHGDPSGFKIVNNLLLFKTITVSNGDELWVTNGNENGTFMLNDVYPGTSSGVISYYAPTNELNKLFFTGFDGNQRMLWETDGTVSGTMPLYDISESDLPIATFAGYINNRLIFGRETIANGNELWSFNASTLSTYDLKRNNSIKIYPNPATNNLMIKTPFTDKYQIQITNQLGQEVLKQNQNTSSASFDISKLFKGLYFLNVTSENGEIQTIKFIKN